MAFKQYPAPKDPNSIMDYGRNWGGDYGFLAIDETIISSQWIIDSDDEPVPTLTISDPQGDGISEDLKSTFIWLKGGTIGIKYNLTNRIVTSDNGRTEDRTAIIFCEAK